MRVSAVPAYVMLNDASHTVDLAQSFRDEAGPVPPRPRATTFRVFDGIVADSNGMIYAGPDAEIIPPTITRDMLYEQRAVPAGGR